MPARRTPKSAPIIPADFLPLRPVICKRYGTDHLIRSRLAKVFCQEGFQDIFLELKDLLWTDFDANHMAEKSSQILSKIERSMLTRFNAGKTTKATIELTRREYAQLCFYCGDLQNFKIR